MSSSAALSNVSSLSFSVPTTSSWKRGGGGGGGGYSCRDGGVPLRRLVLSPVGRSFGLTVKAMGAAEGKDSLDHLDRASKIKQQLPRRRAAAQSAVPIGLWDRFPSARTVQQMMDTMDRILEDPFAYSTASVPPLISGEEAGGGYRRGRTPWEIKEGEGEYKMRFDVPGMTRMDVKVYLEERMLVVKAEKALKGGKEGGEDDVDEDEWSPQSYGKYSSRIALPENVEVEKIKAEVRDGVLYITIPKASPSAKVLDIAVQ